MSSLLTWLDLGVAFLGALCFAWLGLYLPRSYQGTVRAPSWPPTIRWLLRIGCMTEILAAMAFGVLRVRHPAGANVVVPANAPPLDHLVQGLGILCIVVGSVLLVVWRIALTTHERRVHRREVGG